MQNPVYPGNQAAPLPRGEPLILRYRVVLLPETDLERGRQVADRICEAIRRQAVRHDGLGPGSCVTASLGVAVGPLPEGWKVTLHRADKALYRAKADGRDRVICDAVDEAA